MWGYMAFRYFNISQRSNGLRVPGSLVRRPLLIHEVGNGSGICEEEA